MALSSIKSQSNIGIGTDSPNANAIIDMTSSDKGLLIPRMNTAARLGIGTALSEKGLLVFDLDENLFYYWNGVRWIPFPKDLDNTNELQTLSFDSSSSQLTISGGNTVELNIPSSGSTSNTGPTFIDPVVLQNGIGPTTFTVDATAHIPSTATAILLEAEGALDGPEGGDTDAHIKVRADSISSYYVLMRARARGEDDGGAWAGQGIFPIGANGEFQVLRREVGKVKAYLFIG